MATTSSAAFNMPGLFTPVASSKHAGSTNSLFAPTPQFPTMGETTGRQHMIDPGARKRSRNNEGSISHLYSHPATPNTWIDNSLVFSRISDTRSPPPLANERYRLAGGIDKPQGMFIGQTGDYDDYFNLEKQRGMWSAPTSPPNGLPDQIPAHLLPATPNGSKPWVLNQIFSLVGGVAGRLVQFCTVPFRGFGAGGGQAYTFGSEDETVPRGPSNDPFLENNSAVAVQYPVSNSAVEDNYGVQSIESLDYERPRMTKRLKTGESWVMVEENGETISRPATPRLSERRVPNYARSPSQIPRPVSRASTAITPKRPSLIPISRRSTMDKKSFQANAKTTPKPSSRPRAYSRQSYGSPAMFKETSNANTSPLPPESQRLINKMRREELEDDARMRRMSSQMSAMLREAKEALGSKFEVEDEYMDDGGESLNDEGYSEDSPWYQ